MVSPIILASTSPIRARILTDAGISFEARPPRVDESSVTASLLGEGAKPRDIADALAELKALRISAKDPSAIVIGSDQVLACDGELLTKATDVQSALSRLRLLAGKQHQLTSAVVVAEDAKPVWRHVETVTLQMRPLTDQFLQSYLDLAWPDVSYCVGCYKLEGAGIRLFSRIQGDFHAALGLPVLPLLSYLSTRGMVPS